VRFVEDKPVDFDFVRATLEVSARANHWANFGPVTTRLEESLAAFLGLPPERRVVMCASGTAALFALGGLHHHRAGRPLRWVVSAFGFFPSRQGPFADARVLDCDADGLLDRDALAALPDDAWDAALVTNVFGAIADPEPWLGIARERGRTLVLDSALALDAPYRDAHDLPPEIVSFHHTKPWGMGEGGCVLVDREDEDLVRSILNFGAHPVHATDRVSFNGKISDFASAFILQRLRDFSDVSERHHLQYERVVSVARRLGYAVLGGERSRTSGATPGHVPLLAPHPVPTGALANHDLVLRKYYHPLSSGCPRAADLYARIVNVPCHPGLERLSESRLERCLAGILARSAPSDARRTAGGRATPAAL
jgi:dTDP-4-amino-4,6-dideoxygalactose transaminase